MKRKNFKALLVFAIALAAATSVFAGCGDNSTPEEGGEGTPPVVRPDANSVADFGLDKVESLGNTALTGKTIYWLGSSVTYGMAANGISMADYIAVRNNCTCVKEAVSGTTLIDEPVLDSEGNVKKDTQTGKEQTSYVARLKDGDFDTDTKVDILVCQISTNDCIGDKLNKLGEVTADDVKDKSAFDTKTTLGATEYIIAYALETWNCKVAFYSGSYFGENDKPYIQQANGSDYGKLITEINKLKSKWGISVIDLFNDAEFNDISKADYNYYMSDVIHPRMAGYLQWWTPRIEKDLYKMLEN